MLGEHLAHSLTLILLSFCLEIVSSASFLPGVSYLDPSTAFEGIASCRVASDASLDVIYGNSNRGEAQNDSVILRSCYAITMGDSSVVHNPQIYTHTYGRDVNKLGKKQLVLNNDKLLSLEVCMMHAAHTRYSLCNVRCCS